MKATKSESSLAAEDRSEWEMLVVRHRLWEHLELASALAADLYLERPLLLLFNFVLWYTFPDCCLCSLRVL